jgi:zinc transporter 7
MVTWTTATAAILSTGLISLAPNLILILFPDYQAGSFLTLGQAIAAGGLLGDVFLHTVPHARYDETSPGLWILMGFTLFFSADLILRSCDTNHLHTKRSSIILNMSADAMHNFTDGLAIGASYAAIVADKGESVLSLMSSSRGSLAMISILLHEIPHELGDYCTLIRAGCSKRQAIKAQFATAGAAFLGTIVALTVSESLGGDKLIYVTSGGFVYLAATTILPEVLEERCSPSFRLMQLIMFCAGVWCLYIVGEMEEDAHDHIQGQHYQGHDGHVEL